MQYLSILCAGHLMGTFKLENHVFDSGKCSGSSQGLFFSFVFLNFFAYLH